MDVQERMQRWVNSVDVSHSPMTIDGAIALCALAVDDMICAECKHFERTDETEGVCFRITSAVVKPHQSWLRVRSDFGCKLWEPQT